LKNYQKNVKILIITPRIPYPPFRGDKLKIFNISRLLLKHNHVKIVSFLTDEKEKEYAAELTKMGIEIELVPLPLFKSVFNLSRALLSRVPFQIAYYNSPQMHEKIREITARENYDLIYFHLIRSAQFSDSVSGSEALKVVDFTDAVSLYLSRYADVLKNPFKKAAINLELKKIIRYENKAKEFDTLFVCSDIDRKFLMERGVHNNIRLLLNGVDTDTFQYENIAPEKGRIVFTGNMPYFANKDAVIYFSKEIFPKILDKVPGARFYAVGQKPPREIKALAAENIIVTGFVKDIKAEYLKSEVNVAPIRFGAGTLNKIIEAMLVGIPTVATSISINGFPEELKKYVFTADSPEEFAQQVINILDNPNIRTDMMPEASHRVKELLNWEKIVGDFEQYIQTRIKS
jgi:polysaccharide biosynthesis protein PslH